MEFSWKWFLLVWCVFIGKMEHISRGYLLFCCCCCFTMEMVKSISYGAPAIKLITMLLVFGIRYACTHKHKMQMWCFAHSQRCSTRRIRSFFSLYILLPFTLPCCTRFFDSRVQHTIETQLYTRTTHIIIPSIVSLL